MNLTARNLNPDRVQNWSQQKFEKFVSKAEAKGGAFTITGKHFTYQVSVDKAGITNIDVGKKRWFVSKSRVESLMESAYQESGKIADALNKLETKFKFGLGRVRDLSKGSMNDLADQVGTFESNEVAMYGKGTRDDLSLGIGQSGLKREMNFSTTKIDHYNAALGINARSNCKDIHATWQMAKEGKLTQTIGEKVALPSRERVVAWAKFIEKQTDRLDVLGKCKGLNDRSLAAFLMKNCPLGMTGFAQAYKNAEGPQAKLQVITESALFREIKQAAATGELPEQPSKAFDTFYQAAFFRQTSKMGLEFFSAQGIPVIFQVQDMKGQLMMQNRLHAKPWKDLGTRDGFHEPITYSEMRHVDRLKNKLGTLQVKYRELPSPRPEPLPDIRWSPVPVEVKLLAENYYSLKTPEQSPF